MANPKDLIKMLYEVVKLKTGSEFCGMVRDLGDGSVEITIPMICHLTRQSPTNETLATFIPYAPLSSDPIVKVQLDSIMHRNPMNEQFIPFYDEASSKWLGMVEGGTIPLTNQVSDPRQYLNKAMQHVLENMTDEELDQWEQDVNSEQDEQNWESVEPSEKDIIH